MDTNFFVVSFRPFRPFCPLPFQNIFEELSCVGGFYFRNLFGRALRDDGAALIAAFRAEIDDVVGHFDDIEIVFDDENGVALVAKRLEDFQ